MEEMNRSDTVAIEEEITDNFMHSLYGFPSWKKEDILNINAVKRICNSTTIIENIMTLPKNHTSFEVSTKQKNKKGDY